MRKYLVKTSFATLCLFLTTNAFAGNKDRTGQAGATELLINPWGASTGVFGLNVANVSGVEAMKVNIAGMAYTKGTNFGLSRTEMLRGSGINVNNAGIAQKVGNFGTIGLNIMSVGFGDITVTTPDNPEGGIGIYKPTFLNVSLGFAKEFSENISAGVGATFVSEQISDIKANGACFEGGVQYVTGKRNNFHFGITLRNIGTNMRFSGNGFAVEAEAPETQLTSSKMSLHVPTDKFEMPTYLTFGGSYDFYLDENKLQNEEDKPKHRATIMATFVSNSFLNDYLGAGIEYSYKEIFMLRGAYRHEKGIHDNEAPTSFYTGFSAGATVQFPIGKKGPLLALDYSYRPTQRPSNGVHVMSLRFSTRAHNSQAEEETTE